MRGLAAALALLFAGAPVHAAAAPDLSGVWQINRPVTAVRTLEGGAPPLLPAAKAVYERNLAAARRGDRAFDGVGRCLPPGIPRLMFEAQPFEILQRPNTVFFLYQINRLPRRAYVGEQHPARLDQTYLGHAVARWEGPVLVVDSVGFNDLTLIDASGLPHSEALHVVERYRLVGKGVLEGRITVEDPQTFARPWTAVVRYTRRPGYQIPEQVCADSLGR
jgi:hypothetical protein